MSAPVIDDYGYVLSDARFSIDPPRDYPGGSYPFAAPASQTAAWLAAHGLLEAEAVVSELTAQAKASRSKTSRAFWDNLIIRAYDDGIVSVSNYRPE